ncbi:MAG: DUF190 domain-containing protein [Acidimicrobiales bacterium]
MTDAPGASLLTVFTSEGARTPGGHALVKTLIERAREEGLAGASVLRGIEGFGHSGRVQTARLPDIAFDLPMLVQIVDTDERIDEFLPVLVDIVGEELVVRQAVRIDHQAHERPPLDDES